MAQVTKRTYISIIKGVPATHNNTWSRVSCTSDRCQSTTSHIIPMFVYIQVYPSCQKRAVLQLANSIPRIWARCPDGIHSNRHPVSVLAASSIQIYLHLPFSVYVQIKRAQLPLNMHRILTSETSVLRALVSAALSVPY